MNEIRVQFQTPQDFQAFRKMVKKSLLTYDIMNLVVVCTCTSKEVETAMIQFRGKIIN